MKGHLSSSDNAARLDQEGSLTSSSNKNGMRKRQRKALVNTKETDKPVLTFRGNRGRLRLMTEIPLEILLEIFGHLYPVDLLQLSQATKLLRDILMRRSAVSTWKQAFLNFPVPVPPRPSELNEPQYANLLFGRHCNFCASLNKTNVLWACYVRCCSRCQGEKFTSDWIRVARSHGFLLSPGYSIPSNHRKVIYLKSEVEYVREELRKVEGHELSLKQFTAERLRLIQDKSVYGNQCEDWQRRLRQHRLKELEETRQRRKNAIFAKLTEHGWGDELERIQMSDPRALLALPAFRQSKDLTDRMWDNMRSELDEYFEGLKAARLREESLQVFRKRMVILVDVVGKYTLTRPGSEIVPTFADICIMEPFRALIFDSPSDTEITKEAIENLMVQLPNISAEWNRSNLAVLLQLIPASASLANPDDADNQALSPLDLATTFFRCAWCRDPITYPRVLKHSCLMSFHSSVDEDLDDQVIAVCRMMGRGKLPWNYSRDQLTFDEEASEFAKAIVVTCGQDPGAISASAMDELDHRIECLRCVHRQRGRLVMRWRTAILHELKQHYGEGSTLQRWRLVSEADVLRAKQREAKSMGKCRPIADISCVHCRQNYTEISIRRHLQITHGIESADWKSHTFPELDIPMLRPPYAVKIPM